jgi:hypothetical protein
LLVIAGSISEWVCHPAKSVAARNKELETLVIERARRSTGAGRVEALYRADALMHRSLHLDQVLQALVDVAVDIRR